ncbi:50S ribosomal protein L9 [Mesomycoplasma ovipneumoniae]|uniref:Large ribosomal subunit protein bL9 n=1 Tax=Mesomycoplasma ovipneumoniae TaxID=29562 RepID=A0AAW6Q4G7_9BACT|nr:50S ribosomal protein L9 [Mesomycoplasma ovipneumoniae]MDF9627638.1 50S ribosomal protein L9 [Mesomycoplasma ovipneumoniae]MDO4157634.1 50S ribosomal protein L9 [Mesomycoplasma ovipneumoniae]MDO4158415.1 50S ribosomal protein L9 [Mesomycoplasma ovipneumoniae]MDO6822001.1 50S ribosomal protein L9 [Mesomycoplasma ovipneumoniae]MDO6855422.1 50S ribosomal protein L9 [Mesomycoplasma ovipneumoniae]
MKVILLKDTKDGRANSVVEVSAGYASNYLFKNNLAEPFNPRTEKLLKERLKKIEAEKENKKNQAVQLKTQIENTVLWFKLKGTLDSVHGAISAKKIKKELETKDIFIDKHLIQTPGISNFGTSYVTVKLSPEISATLKINVVKDE